MAMTQIHVFYSGTVQGVGFRYTTQRFAATRGVAGWVRNLPDGRVELVAEAPDSLIRDFLSDIDKQFMEYISNKQIDYLTPVGGQKGFRIIG